MQVCIKLVDQLRLECILMKCFWSECGFKICCKQNKGGLYIVEGSVLP